MKDYVLDANAVLRYLDPVSAGGGEKVQELFLQAQRGQARLSMSAVNLGEVLYILIRKIGEQRALHYIRVLQHAVTVLDADLSRTIQAATLKHQYKLGYADSFAASLALGMKATLVSADPTYENIGKSLRWMRLPKFNPAKSR
ncbi:MAG TPA: type II toxin-antitoxin system VapC family toxin [Acidobacteriaceae bacterium]|jgi:predicted nucleic acid-binding protein